MIFGKRMNVVHLPLEVRPRLSMPVWPAISIALLNLMIIWLPAGFMFGLNAYLLGMALIAWLSSGKKFDRVLMHVVGAFVVLMSVGVAGGITSDRYLYMKDMWYILNPLSTICVGFVFYKCMPDVRLGMKALVVGGLLVGVFVVIRVAINPSILTMSAIEVRGALGTGYYGTAVALMILLATLGRWRAMLNLGKFWGGVALCICLFATIISFSRTTYVVVIIGVFSMLGGFSKHEVRNLLFLVLAGLMLIGSLRTVFDVDSHEARKSVIGKIAHSIDEMKIQDYNDYESINTNWRGFETARVLIEYQRGSVPQLFFGQGFGKTVDLGFFQNLSGDWAATTRYIPIFHNGCMFLLIKTGPVGILVFIYAVGVFYVYGRGFSARKDRTLERTAGRLLQAMSVILLFTTWVIAGAFNKSDMYSVLMLMGFLLGYLRDVYEKESGGEAKIVAS